MDNITICYNDHCSNELSKSQIRNKGKFCSKSCSAKTTNYSHSKESRIRQAGKLRKEKPVLTERKTRIYNCQVCGNEFLSYYKKKTCADTCSKKLHSEIRTKFLKENAGTFNWIPNNKPTYFEQSFIDWLSTYDFQFIALTHSIHNPFENTTYFLDLFFPDLNLNIELDGTHHERAENVKRDTIRDEYLKSIGIDVLRISIRDYNKKNNRINCYERAYNFLCP